MGFKRDLSLGNQAENLIQETLTKHNIKTELNKGKNIEYDIKCFFPDREITIEAKFDLYCARSGNIAIEFFNPKQGKPSGVGATKADLWMHVVTNPMSVWVTSVQKLKSYIVSSPAYKTISCGGDDNSSMYLYRKDAIFNDIFHRIDECDSVVFFEIINNLLKGE